MRLTFTQQVPERQAGHASRDLAREARAYTRDQLEGGGLLANLISVGRNSADVDPGYTYSAAERGRGGARKSSLVTDLK